LFHKTTDNWVVIRSPQSINSILDNEPSGSEIVGNIVSISQSNYDAAEIAGNLIQTTTYIVPQTE